MIVVRHTGRESEARVRRYTEHREVNGGAGSEPNAVELRGRSASLCRLGTRFVPAAKGCRPTILDMQSVARMEPLAA